MADNWLHDSTRPAKAPLIDTTVASPARAADFLEGGRDNFEADRVAARMMMAVAPVVRIIVPAARAFHRRVVSYLVAEAGIRQFLDVGAGLATSARTHEVAQSLDPRCRVVYVDDDPMVLSHTRALARSSPEGAVGYVDGHVGDPSAMVAGAGATLDFGEPVALMLLIVLHLIPDADNPYGIVADLLRALPSGSYVVLSHPASDIRTAQMAEMTSRVNERMSGPKATMRDLAAVTRFFDGLELLEPGVVQPQQWRPEPGVLSPAQVTAWCGVARKR